MTVGALLAVLLTLVAPALLATPAQAAPAASAQAPTAPARTAPARTAPDPSTPEGAQRAWVEAAKEYSSFGERVLFAEHQVTVARQQVTAARRSEAVARRAVATADQQVAAAQRLVDAADAKVLAAQQVSAGYQDSVDAFADASFRGARLGSLSALLVAQSPDDFLDTASSLDAVAAQSGEQLDRAVAAQQGVEQARADVVATRAQADRVKAAAQARLDAAARATAQARAAEQRAERAEAALGTERQQLDARIARFQRLNAQLSAADRAAAVDLSDVPSGGRVQAADRSRPGTVSIEDLSVRAAQHAPSVQAGIAVQAALSRVGLPYVWGATGPDEFDCSGLMMWAWAKAGVSLPRTSAEQAASLRVIPLSELQPGDLITFYQPTSHVGMYIGDGLMVHASMTGVPLKITALSDRAGDDPVGHAVNR